MAVPYVVTLGTAGGPRWWERPGAAAARSGIATAVVIEEAVYLVDVGQGACRQLARAGLRLDRVRGLFLTHLHSDHVADMGPLILFSPFERIDPGLAPLRIFGPGRRGALPALSPHATMQPEVVAPRCPTPGTVDMVQTLCAAYATDFNDRLNDSRTRPPSELFAVQDIAIPDGLPFDPNGQVAPPMEPFEIHSDELVTVTATLVAHPPTAPAFAFRFTTADGSVTISGDTAPCDNLVRLARGTDLLLHEAIDLDTMRSLGSRFNNPEIWEATMAHHQRAHTTARQAGEIATAAAARTLALHHLVPGDLPEAAWTTASETFHGKLLIPEDLDVIEFAAPTD